MNMYDIARQVTDEVLGEGAYADVNKGNPDPNIQAAIKRSAADEVQGILGPDERPTEFRYAGKIYVRPIGRGICLVNDDGTFDDGSQLEDRVPEGYYQAIISMVKIDE